MTQSELGQADRAGPDLEAERQVHLPLRKAIRIAWRGIRIRWWRSMLVTSGIILSLAFLTYVLCSDAHARNVEQHGSKQLHDSLVEKGLLIDGGDDGMQEERQRQRVQTLWLVGLALLVSFVGILNAMLMSVTERFAEIGTMKCLGALDSFVIKLFMLESVFQGAAGATIGIAAGLGLALVEASYTYGAESWRLIPLGSIGRIVGGCLAAGLLLTIAAAMYPAWRAARMQPVEAMRAKV